MKKRAEQSTTQQVTEAIADSNRAARNFDRRSSANTVVMNVAYKMAYQATYPHSSTLTSAGSLVINEDDSADAVLSWRWVHNGETLDLATTLHLSEQERDNLTELWLLDRLWRKGHGVNWLRRKIAEVQDAQRPLPAFGTRMITSEQAAAATKAAVEEVRNRSLREQNTQLVTEMVAGAGFELTSSRGGHGNDPIPFYATWEQILPERTNVKVTFALSASELELPPAQVFRIVFDQVGAK